MSRYLLIYQGVLSGPPPEMTEEQEKQMMDAWGTWMENNGPALVDGGAPVGERSSVGGSGTPLAINGYSIIEAADMDAARAICDHHPYLAGAPSDFSVDVYELTPIEM